MYTYAATIPTVAPYPTRLATSRPVSTSPTTVTATQTTSPLPTVIPTCPTTTTATTLPPTTMFELQTVLTVVPFYMYTFLFLFVCCILLLVTRFAIFLSKKGEYLRVKFCQYYVRYVHML